jgi:hypothetical protein
MNKIQHKVRPRIQRAFLSWFAENGRRFACPIRIKDRTRNYIELEFIGANGMVSASLTYWEINVSFDWQGECWDLFICFEAMPELTAEGYVCSLCVPELCWPEPIASYLTRDHLWRNHLFEPFLDWVNTTLAISPWIEIYGKKDHSTSAQLLKTKPDLQSGNITPDHLMIANPLYNETTHN